MDSIRENHGDRRPFLAYLAFAAPHDPLHVPEPWLSKYKGRYAEGYEALRRSRIEGSKRSGVVPSDAAPPPERHPLVRPWSSLTEEERALLDADLKWLESNNIRLFTDTELLDRIERTRWFERRAAEKEKGE